MRTTVLAACFAVVFGLAAMADAPALERNGGSTTPQITEHGWGGGRHGGGWGRGGRGGGRGWGHSGGGWGHGGGYCGGGY